MHLDMQQYEKSYVVDKTGYKRIKNICVFAIYDIIKQKERSFIDDNKGVRKYSVG